MLRVAFLSALVLELVATLSVALVAVGVGLRLLDGALDLRTALVVLILAPEAYLPVRAVGASFHASAEGLSAADRGPRRAGRAGRAGGAGPAPDARADGRRCSRGVDRARWTTAGPAVLDRRRPDRWRPADHGRVAPERRGQVHAARAARRLRRRRTPGRCWSAAPTSPTSTRPPGARGLAWLPQRPTLVPGTVADNVRLGEPDADDEEVRRALRAAGAWTPWDLPAGAATVLGEQGAGLSAGQRQRVALARLLLRIRRRDCGLVLLDEPTAHLDARHRGRGGRRAAPRAAPAAPSLVATHRPAAGGGRRRRGWAWPVRARCAAVPR